MTDKAQDILTGELVTESPDVTLEELCNACRASSKKIEGYVSEGIIQPIDEAGEQWFFSHVSIVEVRRAQRLESDLGLNAAGVALAFELMAEIEALKRRLSRHERIEDDDLSES
jgi:chaperone modulatory protein CbpM